MMPLESEEPWEDDLATWPPRKQRARRWWAIALLAVPLTGVALGHVLYGCQTLVPTTATTKPTVENTPVLATADVADTEPSVVEDPKPQVVIDPGPCGRLDLGDHWAWGTLTPDPEIKGYVYQASIAVRHGEVWTECPSMTRFKIADRRDWNTAWSMNHPIMRRAPLRKFDPSWAMDASPEPPLLQIPKGAKSVGLPHDGRIENGIHPPLERPGDYPYFLDRGPERSGFSSSALESMVIAMQQALHSLGEQYQGLQFVVFDASLVTGGRMGRRNNPEHAHGSHQSGRDVDIAIALRDIQTGHIYWGHRGPKGTFVNRDSALNHYAKRVGSDGLKARAREIRDRDRKRAKRRKKKYRKPKKSPLERAREQLDREVHVFVYDAIWQLVLKAWFPGHLRWAFLDKPQQRTLIAAAKRAKQFELADAIVAFDARRKRYRRHSAVRCLYQSGGPGHDHHIHLRFNCAPDEEACED